MVDSRGRYFPWTLRHTNRNMTWTKTWWCSGHCDFHQVTQRSKETQRIGSVQRFNGLKCMQRQSVVFKGDSKSYSVMFSKTCLAYFFQFPPHSNRRVPLFDLTSLRRVTHARYNSPSISSSSFFNELEEVRVWSHMGLSMFCLVSPKTENSKVFHDYRVWKNT